MARVMWQAGDFLAFDLAAATALAVAEPAALPAAGAPCVVLTVGDADLPATLEWQKFSVLSNE